MKTLLAAVLLLGASSAAAKAETFTFSTTSTATNQIIAAVANDKPVVAAFATGSGQNVYASGKKTTDTFNCANWSATAGSIFQTYGACVYTELTGDQASIVIGCDFTNKAQTEADCWGGLTGTVGSVANKTGTISWHQKLGADGKSGTASGTGQWND